MYSICSILSIMWRVKNSFLNIFYLNYQVFFSQHMNSLVTRNDTIYAWISELTSKPDGRF